MTVLLSSAALIWVASAFTTAFIASQKDRDIIAWFFSGLFFGVFALIAVAASPALWEMPSSARYDSSEPRHDPQPKSVSSKYVAEKSGIKLFKTPNGSYTARGITFRSVEEFEEWAIDQ